MKATKKLATLFLAMVMVFAMVIPTLAAGTGSITVTNPKEDQKYTIYKMFDLESYDETTGAYSYKIETTSDWYGFVTSTGFGATYFNVDTQGYVTLKTTPTEEQKAELAKEALLYAADKGIAGTTYTITEADQTAGSYTFSGLDLGYYVIDSSVGTLCALTTTKPDATLNEKNTEPTISKIGQVGITTIGGMNTYTITINAKKGAENYVLHDTMGEGLTFGGSVSVKANDILLSNTNYDLVTDPALLTDGCTFEVRFHQDYLDTITSDTTIKVQYNVYLNKNSVIGEPGNPNVAKLTYGDDHETAPASYPTKTYFADIVKTNADGKVIDGAEFELYGSMTSTTKLPLVKISDTEYRLADIDEQTAPGFVSATITAGKVRILGLGTGSWALEEIKAPAGYNKLSSRVLVKVENYNVEATMDPDDPTQYKSGGVQVINLTGTELPSTGGIGTTIFYVAGSLLAVGAIILLVTKKRMNSNI